MIRSHWQTMLYHRHQYYVIDREGLFHHHHHPNHTAIYAGPSNFVQLGYCSDIFISTYWTWRRLYVIGVPNYFSSCLVIVSVRRDFSSSPG
mmetsp:Transcript_29100/g.46750  ORF Transcript_29100/g.46750 Transcript_29100/m.46750 type:complete len:91 (+) Transcript_29100:436-708(+)